MTRRSMLPAMALGALLLATPLASQEAPPAPPHVHERIERLRHERLREALRLDEGQAERLRRSLEESRREGREAMGRHQEAIEALRRELQRDPVDQAAVRRALAAVAAQREALGRLRAAHDERLGRILSPEQRAKLLLFNRTFDHRLRELILKRHGRGFPAARPR